jgi:phosphoglycolate phosphatase
LKILEFFGVGPHRCLYVGDSEVDYRVCQASGVPLIAYRNRNLKAAYFVENLLDILRILQPCSLDDYFTHKKRGD